MFARVERGWGGIATHVKALNMQTVGLGGDNLIHYDKERLVIGPRRVGPVVWPDAARRMVKIMAAPSRTKPEGFVDHLLEKFEKN